MSNSYKYIDPDYTYTDPKTGLLYSKRDKLSHLDLKFSPRRHGVHRVYSQLLILLGVRDIALLSSRSSFSVFFFVFSVPPWSYFL